MNIIHSDAVFKVPEGGSPDYNRDNPLLKLVSLIEKGQLAAEREFYLQNSFQYLFPFKHLSMYGPSGSDANNLDPTQQDNKTDFQKQNVSAFLTTDTRLVRGWVQIGDWIGPFLRVSYRGGVDSKLSVAANHQLGEKIKLWMRVGNVASPHYISVPYNPLTDWYEVELWGDPGFDIRNQLDEKGLHAQERGELLIRGDLIKGTATDFDRDVLNDKYLVDLHPENTMHPILPLNVEMAWTNFAETVWDSQEGTNYKYAFNMTLRGWNNYLGTGISPNPHGGVGFLEYRNLISNYGRYAGRPELGRTIAPWSFDAFGNKQPWERYENFFSVDYMDLHILKPTCGIGLHRHRDNQEVFLMMEGQGLMVVGDWCKMDDRERCFEVRTLKSGEMAMLKGGNLHALMNVTDEDCSLFMFGGYD